MESFHPEVKYYGIPIFIAMQEYMIYCKDGQVKPVVRTTGVWKFDWLYVSINSSCK